jgi:PAS domain S-box-containing protein
MSQLQWTYRGGQLVGEGKRALVAEDNPSMLRMLEKALRQRGYEVTCCADGASAWERFQEELYPLVILDWMLPGASGLEITEWIRNHPRARYTTVLMTTGRTSPRDQEQALDAGVDDYLVKPFSVRLLSVRLAVAEQRVQDRIARHLADAERETVEETVRHLFHNFPDIVFRIDREGRFTYVNQAVSNLGYSPEELTGEHFSVLLHPEDAERVSREAVLPLHAGTPTGDQKAPKLMDERRTGARGTTDLEIRLRNRSGEGREAILERIAEVTACGVYDTTQGEPDRHFDGSIGVMRDITERKRSQQALITSERLAAVGTLAAGVAHEFNNLNVGILGYADLLRSAEDLPEHLRARVETVYRAARTAQQITGKLLSFARSRTAERVSCDLNDVVRNTLDLVELGLEKERITLRRELEPVPAVVANPGEISQVLLNLLVNAQHAVHGCDEPAIEVRTFSSEDAVSLQVRDTGCGISEEHRTRIFSPFFSTKGEHAAPGSPSADLRGTGLGLSLCHTIVEAHGGTISVESRPEVGTTFTVSLPLAAGEPPPPAAPAGET